MSPEEQAIAIAETHPYREAVTKGYPLLQRSGEELRASGVAFHDMTGVFADTREIVYADNCCHVNERGNEILADAMAKHVNDDLASRAGEPSRPTTGR